MTTLKMQNSAMEYAATGLATFCSQELVKGTIHYSHQCRTTSGHLASLGAIATIIASHRYGDVSVGDRITIDDTDIRQVASLDPVLYKQIELNLQKVLTTRRTTHHSNSNHSAGFIEILLEYVSDRHRLVVFGAGHDAIAFVAIPKLQGWRVYVVAARSHFAHIERFLSMDGVLCLSNGEPFTLSVPTENSAVMIMTHSLSQDRHGLEKVLNCFPQYVGQRGPKYRTERLFGEINPAATNSAAFLEFHYPVELDVGGHALEATVLSISSEIIAVFNGSTRGNVQVQDINDSLLRAWKAQLACRHSSAQGERHT